MYSAAFGVKTAGEAEIDVPKRTAATGECINSNKTQFKGGVAVAWFKASSSLVIRSYQQSRFQEKKKESEWEFYSNLGFVLCEMCVVSNK